MKEYSLPRSIVIENLAFNLLIIRANLPSTNRVHDYTNGPDYIPSFGYFAIYSCNFRYRAVENKHVACGNDGVLLKVVQ